MFLLDKNISRFNRFKSISHISDRGLQRPLRELIYLAQHRLGTWNTYTELSELLYNAIFCRKNQQLAIFRIYHQNPEFFSHPFPSRVFALEKKIYSQKSSVHLLVTHFRIRTREVDLLDEFLNAPKLTSIIGFFHRSSVSSISVTGLTTSMTTFFQ